MVMGHGHENHPLRDSLLVWIGKCHPLERAVEEGTTFIEHFLCAVLLMLRTVL